MPHHLEPTGRKAPRNGSKVFHPHDRGFAGRRVPRAGHGPGARQSSPTVSRQPPALFASPDCRTRLAAPGPARQWRSHLRRRRQDRRQLRSSALHPAIAGRTAGIRGDHDPGHPGRSRSRPSSTGAFPSCNLRSCSTPCRSMRARGADLQTLERQLRRPAGRRAHVSKDWAHDPAMYASLPLINAPAAWDNVAIGGCRRMQARASRSLASMDGGAPRDAPMFDGTELHLPDQLQNTRSTSSKIIVKAGLFPRLGSAVSR